MSHSLKLKLGLFVSMVMLAACAAKPPNVQAIPDTADSTAEIDATQKMLDDAKADNLDIISPKNYERASKKLGEAREYMVRGKSKEKILEDVAESRAWIEEAKTRGNISRAAAKDLSDARSGAIRANAPTLYPKDFAKVDEETKDLAADAEKGNLAKLSKRGDEITNKYRHLERESVEKTYLSEAQINLQAAKKDNAEKFSPKTYGVVQSKVQYVEALIKENPRNTQAIANAAADATDHSKFLLAVNQKTKAGNTEDLVLQSEKQRRLIGGLAVGMAATEVELAQKNAALKTAEELRKSLKPSEAEVFVENNAVKVRLKGVQFGSNSATISKKSASLLEKVDHALGVVGANVITVEGYTDSVGSPEANREISEKRAEAVQNYMVNKGKLSSNQIKAVGRGEDNPISDNTTAHGRAQNRRIDLVIEPKVDVE